MFNANKIKDEIVLWIQNYFDRNGKGAPAVVGISGGKDSSVVAALCAEALGRQNVHGVLMPCGEQWDLHISQELVKHLGIHRHVVNIDTTVDALTAALQDGGVQMNKQAATNTPARIRMATLYAVAAVVGGRVANTCNLSEDWVGYSTKFGDSAGDFSPLSHLTATEVKAVGKALGLPEMFVEKTPEDGLSGLSDEENLGFSYATLDEYIRHGTCPDKPTKEKIDALYHASRHKLQLMPCYTMENDS